MRLDPLRTLIAARRGRRNLARGLEAFHPAHGAQYAHAKALGRRIARHPALDNRLRHPLAKIIGKRHPRRLLPRRVSGIRTPAIRESQNDSVRSETAPSALRRSTRSRIFAMKQDRPPRRYYDLDRQSHDRFTVVHPNLQAIEPAAQPTSGSAQMQQARAGAVYLKPTQVTVVSLTDTQRRRLAGGRIFARNEVEPRHHIARLSKLPPGAGCNEQRGRSERSNARNRHQAARSIVRRRNFFEPLEYPLRRTPPLRRCRLVRVKYCVDRRKQRPGFGRPLHCSLADCCSAGIVTFRLPERK